MKEKIKDLEWEVEMLKSTNNNLEMKIELKEVQENVSYLMTEQLKITDRTRAFRIREF